ncbi:GntR family transcriptional regulator [Asticcacaulis sp.]|uniref:GntR family transcriptional regulator n=1 Tax=Asticcacaulis sp. TaxID=1872648 RepID=UPI00391CA3FE
MTPWQLVTFSSGPKEGVWPMVGKPLAYEKVYETIKDAIKAGVFWPGERIDNARLKALVGTSHIPIREALRRLSAEGLVEAHRREGFSVPYISEQSLRGQYDWLHASILFAARNVTPVPADLVGQIDFEAIKKLPIEEATARFFLAIAIASGNCGVEATVRTSNDCLHLVRTLKESLILDRGPELVDLITTWQTGPFSALETALTKYFSRRMERVPQIVGLIQRRTTFL